MLRNYNPASVYLFLTSFWRTQQPRKTEDKSTSLPNTKKGYFGQTRKRSLLPTKAELKIATSLPLELGHPQRKKHGDQRHSLKIFICTSSQNIYWKCLLEIYLMQKNPISFPRCLNPVHSD